MPGILKRTTFVSVIILAGVIWLPVYITVIILSLPVWIFTNRWLVVGFLEWTIEALERLCDWCKIDTHSHYPGGC